MNFSHIALSMTSKKEWCFSHELWIKGFRSDAVVALHVIESENMFTLIYVFFVLNDSWNCE